MISRSIFIIRNHNSHGLFGLAQFQPQENHYRLVDFENLTRYTLSDERTTSQELKFLANLIFKLNYIYLVKQFMLKQSKGEHPITK